MKQYPKETPSTKTTHVNQPKVPRPAVVDAAGGSTTPPVRYGPRVRGEALKSKLKMFGGGGG
jgi:hypothetical protein